MVWFHGGGFLAGSGKYYEYSPEILLDRDVILVTTNYRLGKNGIVCTFIYEFASFTGSSLITN